MVTRDDQLEHPANFEDDDGRLYLVRCIACSDAEGQPRGLWGRENYLPAVATGKCVWCGWSE